MKKMILAIAALFAASPVVAQQDAAKCATVTVASAKAADLPALIGDAECFGKAAASASNSQVLRLAKAAALASEIPVPTPTPTPAPAPVPTPAALSGILDEGDSQSIFWGGNHTGIYAATHPGIEYSGKAVGGARINDVAGGNGLNQRLAADIATHPAIVTLLIGANDLGDSSYAGAGDWLAALWAYTARWKATGAKVALGTVLPQCNVAVLAERRPIVNAAIRAAVGTKIDAVIDYAADPELGPDAAACDKTLYSDGLHPTDGGITFTGGQGKMARIYGAALDKLIGSASAPAAQPLTVTPIASNFDTSALIVPGYQHGSTSIPPKMDDSVGAFRFICEPGQLLYADPILFPGDPSKSHLHQFYGNTGADANSTYATLRATGDSTCSNKLNRSAYWVPALMNAAGKVIVPDYLSIYYKRHPDGDPACLLESAKGCATLPTGLRVVSGYDMKRMGQVQPENATYTFRCISPNKPSVHRGTLTPAIADCGGSGQVMAAINFGACWNGDLDSADHRSHLVHAQYIGQAYAQCPADHPYIIPELTQQIAYTIAASDGDVWFASDHMGGMSLAGGSSFHADYMEGWDPATRATWEHNCIGQLLNCSDGELGDGTMLKRGALPVVASPRLIAAPAR